jgi:transposase
MYYMGIDHHKQSSHLTILDEQGDVIKEGPVVNRRVELESFLEGFPGDLKAVIEAGRSSYTMVDMLDELGVGVAIAHPYQVKAIASAKIKTDKRDSKILAQLLRLNMIPEVYRRSAENREAQRIIRNRMFYVQIQTKLKNKIRALLAKQGEEIRQLTDVKDKLFSKKGLEILRQIDLSEKDKEVMFSLVDTLEHIQEKISYSDKLVDKLYAESPEAQLIFTIPGFGVFLSVLVATEIAEIRRFGSVSNLHSYAGVIPSTHSSGGKLYHGRLVKEGNKRLRWGLIEAVWPAIQKDIILRIYYQKRRAKKGANTAKVATARRLLSIIYSILREERPYVTLMDNKRPAAFSQN